MRRRRPSHVREVIEYFNSRGLNVRYVDWLDDKISLKFNVSASRHGIQVKFTPDEFVHWDEYVMAVKYAAVLCPIPVKFFHRGDECPRVHVNLVQ